MPTVLLLMLLWLPGCASRRAVTLDSNRDVVRLGPDVTGHVSYRDKESGKFVQTANKVKLPEGWMAGPFTPPPQIKKSWLDKTWDDHKWDIVLVITICALIMVVKRKPKE